MQRAHTVPTSCRHWARHWARGTALVVAVAVSGLMLGGCGESPRTVSEVQQSYAERFIEGMSLGAGGQVKAEGFDARSGELVSVSVDLGEQGMLHARRATIVIDPVANTMRLRLLGVTVAPVGGTLESRDEVWTDAVRLTGRVVADAAR